MIDIAAEFEPVLGLHAWGVSHGYGSFVTLEFGNPELRIQTPRLVPIHLDGAPSKTERRVVRARGQWHLWIYCCDWSISINEIQLAHNESDDARIERALSILNGQILTNVSVKGATQTTFDFDLGAALTTWASPPDSYDGEDVEQWYLYEPDGQVLALRSDGYVSLGPGNRTEDEHDWFPRTLGVRKPEIGSSSSEVNRQ
jgi:hypothetical protein